MSILYPIKFILALCSIVYELLLAQGLSAFMEDTVLRYSVTIGLYMFSLGVGAWLCGKRASRNAVLALSGVEILLTMIGAGSVALLYAGDMIYMPRLLFGFSAHALIILIGVLTGMEIPLIVELRTREKAGTEDFVLAADYAGALAGTLVFAFILYSRAGLVAAAFVAGLLNAAAGIMLVTQRDKVGPRAMPYFKAGICVQVILCVVIVVCLVNSASISEFFYLHYTR